MKYRSDSLNSVDPLESFHGFAVEYGFSAVTAGAGSDVYLCEAAHGLDALPVGLLIAEPHRNEHYDTHDADSHGKTRQQTSGLSPEKIRKSETEQILQFHSFS